MEQLNIWCPCGNVFDVSEALLGKNVRCLKCARLHVVRKAPIRRAEPVVGRSERTGSGINILPFLWLAAGVGVCALMYGFYVWFVKPSVKSLDRASQEAKRTDSKVTSDDFKLLPNHQPRVDFTEPLQPEAPFQPFAQKVSKDPRARIREFKCEEVQSVVGRAHGTGAEGVLWEIHLYGTPAEMEEAVEAAGTPKTEKELEELLAARARIHEAQGIFAKYDRCDGGRFGWADIERRSGPTSTHAACAVYFYQFDQLIPKIDAQVVEALRRIRPPAASLRDAARPPWTKLLDAVVSYLGKDGQEFLMIAFRNGRRELADRLVLTARMRLETGDVRFAKWTDVVTPEEHAALLREAAKKSTKGREAFTREFVRHRIGELPIDGLPADEALVGLLVGRGATADAWARAFVALGAKVPRDGSTEQREGLRRAAAISKDLLELLPDGDRTEAILELGEVVERVDRLSLRSVSASTRKKILEILSASYASKEPNEARDQALAAWKREHDPLPDLVAGYRKHGKHFELLLEWGDDRVVALLVEQRKKDGVSAALTRITRARPKDWAQWYKDNKSRLAKQL